MTVALFPNGTHPVKIRPLTGKPSVRRWQDELSFLENEVTFYCKLLTMNLNHGTASSNIPMLTLRNEFSELLEIRLPEMNAALQTLSHHPAEDWNHTWLAFQKQLDQLKQELQKLKTGVFPLIIHLQRITIW